MDKIAVHLAPDVIGAHAAEANGAFLGSEFCQPERYTPIEDGQIRAFVYWFANYARVRWPGIPAVFPTHAETDQWTWTTYYGKDDPFPFRDARSEALRQRIYAEMDRWRIWR